MVNDFRQAVVIDAGSASFKAGFAGEKAPQAIFPPVIGRPRHGAPRMGPGWGPLWYYFGDKALALSHVLTMKCPLEDGIIINWDDMEKVWWHTFHDLLHVELEHSEHPILITEPPLNPKSQRKLMMQIFFETFDVPAFCVMNEAALSLCASGRTTGIVVTSGYGVSHAVPIYEGFALPHAISKVDIAGRALTEELGNLCSLERGKLYSVERRIVQDIKERLCYVALDFEEERIGTSEYALPDGKVLSVGNERFRVPEALFKPSFMGSESLGIHEATYNSIQKCDADLHKNLFGNVLLSGGSTRFPGFAERMQKELNLLASRNVKVQAPPERKDLAWIGGSIWAALSTFPRLCISRQDYDEYVFSGD